MVDVDVVVVGAGPAGTSVSYDLLCERKTVIILDRFDFPRFKACAGGLTVKTLNALRYSVDSVIRKNCYDLIIGKGYKKTKRFRSKNKICGMIVRSEFDDFCLKQCRDRGVKFKKIRKIYKIEEGHDYIEIFTDIGSLKSRFLVGADGANSNVRALSNTFPEIKKGLAIQARIPCKPDDLPDMEFDFFVVKNGYGWVFPKNNHINVGLGTNDTSIKLTGNLLRQYCIQKLGVGEIKEIAAHHIGLNGWQYQPYNKRVSLIGDAAGLVDPLLGEGIYNAVRSGQILAQSIIEGKNDVLATISLFSKGLKEVQKDLLSCYKTSFWFYRIPAIGYATLTLPTTRYFLMKGFSRGWTFSKIKTNSYKLSFWK